MAEQIVAERTVAPTDDAPEPDSLKKRFLNIKTLASFALGITIILVVMSRMNVEIGAILSRLASINPLYYVAALLIYHLTFLVRGLRWRKLLENVGFHQEAGVRLPPVKDISVIVLLSWFANCIVPAKLGDAYRAHLLKREAGVSFSRTFGTILAERMIDMLLLFGLLGASVLFMFGGSLPPAVLSMMQIGFGLAIVVVVGLFAMRHMSGFITRLVPKRFRRHYGQLEEGTLGSFQAMPLVLTYSAVAWGIEAGRLYLVCMALGLFQLSIPLVLFVALAAALMTTLPITPAGLGFVESAIVGILVLSSNFGLAPGIDETAATSVAILDRTISYWSLIVVGLAVQLLGRRKPI